MLHVLRDDGYYTLEGEKLLTTREAADKLKLRPNRLNEYLSARGAEPVDKLFIFGHAVRLWLESDVKLSKVTRRPNVPESERPITAAARARTRFKAQYGGEPHALTYLVKEWLRILQEERNAEIRNYR